MNAPKSRMGIEWLALTGVGIGLMVALIVDRTILERHVDRRIILAAITGIVAILWMALMRLVIFPTPAGVNVSKRKES